MITMLWIDARKPESSGMPMQRPSQSASTAMLTMKTASARGGALLSMMRRPSFGSGGVTAATEPEVATAIEPDVRRACEPDGTEPGGIECGGTEDGGMECGGTDPG
jgi:hypothetical protein